MKAWFCSHGEIWNPVLLFVITCFVFKMRMVMQREVLLTGEDVKDVENICIKRVSNM